MKGKSSSLFILRPDRFENEIMPLYLSNKEPVKET
jgi:hypothetical protein